MSKSGAGIGYQIPPLLNEILVYLYEFIELNSFSAYSLYYCLYDDGAYNPAYAPLVFSTFPLSYIFAR